MARNSSVNYLPERFITAGPGGRILTNTGVWSPDGRWIVYDTRSDADGTLFDGMRIEIANVETGEVRIVYESKEGACCGVATFHPNEPRVVFILGPEKPTPDWTYGQCHRQGVTVDLNSPGVAVPLDARDIMPPYTSGALRGGSHVHVYSPDGQWVSFTYNDHVLAAAEETDGCETDQRNVGVSVPARAVSVPKSHTRSHDGSHFSVLVTRTVEHPTPGSDEIRRACEEGWIGANGYLRPDGSRQRRALAFQGEVIASDGSSITEVFVVDIPDEVTIASQDGPLEGTTRRRPRPPRGTVQRRLTFTENRRFPGLSSPRHWLRSSPDGYQIAFLMRDDTGIVQIWTVSPNGGSPRQVTSNPWDIASAFTWSPDGHRIACAADNSVFVVDAETGNARRLTHRSSDGDRPLPLACVFSPDGCHIAFQRRIADVSGANGRSNQICVVSVDE